MYEIPTKITVQDTQYHIRNDGDYRVILECFVALNDGELSENERVFACMVIFSDDIDFDDIFAFNQEHLEAFISEMFNFINCGETNGVGAKTKHKVIDWEQDQQMICAGINKVAGTEVRALPYLHWWTFMGYFCSIGESTLSTVVSIRDKILKGKKLEKYEREFRQENPQYFTWDSRTLQEKEDDELLKQLWDFGEQGD